MMRFDLDVNGHAVTTVSVIAKGPAMSTDNRDGWYVYEWNAWRPRADGKHTHMTDYAAGELMHNRNDGIEMLAIKVLQEYLSVWQE